MTVTLCIKKIAKMASNSEIFIDALSDGNCEIVQKQLVKEPSLMFTQKIDFMTPLCAAVTFGYPDVVKLLVRLGANIEDRYMGETLLTWLVKSAETEEHVKLLEFLLQQGADVNAQRPLYHAIRQGKLKFAEFLLKYSAELDTGPKPALFVAAANSNPEKSIRLLLKYHVNVKTRRFGRNILHCLSDELSVDSLEVVELLIKQGASLNEFDGLGFTPLHYAIRNNRAPLIGLFLKYRANVNDLSLITNESPLYMAAGVDNPANIDLLIEEGASVNEITKDGQTALHRACRSLHLTNVKILLERGARINLLDKFGRSPFALVDISEKNLSIIKFMIRRLARMQVEDELLNSSDLNCIRKEPLLHEYYKECSDELTSMKNIKFYGDFSIYDVLQKEKRKLAKLLMIKEFFLELESCDLTEVLRHYVNDLYEKLIEADILKCKLVKMEANLDKIIGDRLPALPKQIILEYLKPRDLFL